MQQQQMFQRRRTRLRAVRDAVLALLVFGVLISGTAGAYLAMYPRVGGWVSTDGTRPPLGGGMSSLGPWSVELCRTTDGILNNTKSDSTGEFLTGDGKRPTPGAAVTKLGRVTLSVQQDYLAGSPIPTIVKWTIDVKNIEPAVGGGGPAASDEQAWRAIVAQWFATRDRSPTHFDITGGGGPPPNVLAGDATGIRVMPLNFFRNMGLRLWHAPEWLRSCIGATVLMSLLTLFVRWPRRGKAGCCWVCGYDLKGSVGRVCPECGVAV